MNHFVQWVRMGGYASYVWSSYSLGVLVLGINIIVMKFQHIKMRKKLQHWFKEQS